jgi:hypothetical protein
MRPPFRLITLNGVSHDTVECLEALLKRARRGEVIGVAYAAMYRRRQYTVHTCGEAHRNPTFARGMVDALSDELSRQVWEEGT